MFGFLGFFFIFILVIILLAITLLQRVVRFLFGFGHKSSNREEQRGGYSTGSSNEKQGNSSQKSVEKRKIFDKNEGEYVEYEEVKE
ncbi:MAG: DUF4834 family protein [Phocaeicola sp.]